MSKHSQSMRIARPYAKAAFEFAKARKNIDQWHDMLCLVQDVIREANLCFLLHDPNVSYVDVGQAFLGCLKNHIDKYMQNFMALLVENRRLDQVSSIFLAYEHCMREDKQELDATLITAFPVEASFVNTLASELKAKLNQTVTLSTVIDQTLLGGAMLRIDDWVVDSSLRSKLNSLRRILVN